MSRIILNSDAYAAEQLSPDRRFLLIARYLEDAVGEVINARKIAMLAFGENPQRGMAEELEEIEASLKDLRFNAQVIANAMQED